MGGGGGLGNLITLGAIIYTGGAAAGLWGAEAAAGAGLMEGAELASVAGEGFGADALFSQAAGYNGLAGAVGAASAGGWITDPTTGLETWSGDATTTGLDTTIQELGNGQWDLPDWASNSVDNMGFNNAISDTAKEAAQSFGATGDVSVSNPIGSLTNNSPISINNQLNYPTVDSFTPDSTALSSSQGTPEVSSNIDSIGDGGTSVSPKSNTLEGITSDGGNSGQGISQTGGNTGFQPQKYTYENKDFLTGKTGTGMTADVSELAPNFKQGLEMNNLPDIWNKANTPLWDSGSKLFKAPTPLGIAGRGLGALFDMKSNKDAMDMYRQQMERFSTDPNRARGDTANQLWTDNFTNPSAGYDTFMQGAGRDFVNQARAAAAKSGTRGSYLDSGKMQTDLASLYAKNQFDRSKAIAGGFSAAPPYAASMVPGYADMMRNQYAPLSRAVNSVNTQFKLSDMFGDQ